MITLRIQVDAISVEYNGVKIALTEHEIEAACRYKEYQQHLEKIHRPVFKKTGIIRKMDDLGRLPIPRVIQQLVGLPKDVNGVMFELGTITLADGKKALITVPYEDESGGEA